MNAPCARRIAALLTLFLLLVPLWNGMEKAGPPRQEGALLFAPELILKGALPYRDVEIAGGPANGYLLAAAYAAFGPAIAVERGVGLLCRLLIVAALFMLLQRRGLTVAAGGAVLAGVILLCTGLAAFPALGALACALWSLWCGGAGERRGRGVAAGVLAGLTFLFQPGTGLALLFAGVPLWLPMAPAPRRALLLALLGCLLPLGVLIIFAGPAEVLHGFLLAEARSTGPLPKLALALLALHAGAVCSMWLPAGSTARSCCPLPCSALP